MSVISLATARGYAVAAGFTGSSLDTVLAIAQAESGLDTTARNVNTDSHTFPDGHLGPSTDRGILQINNYWHPEYSDAQCDDPAQAFAAGWTISAQGSNFTPWSTYTSGAYRKYLPVTSGIPRNPAPLSQLHEPTKDGAPDENTNNNCGETSLAWVVRDLGNEPDCDGDEIHDEVIGQGVLGGSDLRSGGAVNPKYQLAANKRGVQLQLFTGTQAQLVAKCHQVMTEPAGDVLANFGGSSNYLQQFSDPANFSGFGHICAIAHSVSGGLELMDPWIGGWRTYTDAELAKMIVWGYIVVATPLPAAPAPQGGTSVTVPSGWTDDGTTLRAPNGVSVVHGMRAYVLSHAPWDPTDVPMGPEEGVAQVEVGNPALAHPGVVQFFRMTGQLSWDGSFNGGAVWKTWDGQEEFGLRRALDAAAVQVNSLSTQLQAANATAAQAKSDAAAAQAAQAKAEADAQTAQGLAAQAQADLKNAQAQDVNTAALVADLKKVLGLS